MIFKKGALVRLNDDMIVSYLVLNKKSIINLIPKRMTGYNTGGTKTSISWNNPYKDQTRFCQGSPGVVVEKIETIKLDDDSYYLKVLCEEKVVLVRNKYLSILGRKTT